MNLDSVGANCGKRLDMVSSPISCLIFSSITLYRLDINVRAASILGLVSAGGIGSILTIASTMWSWELLGDNFSRGYSHGDECRFCLFTP